MNHKYIRNYPHINQFHRSYYPYKHKQEESWVSVIWDGLSMVGAIAIILLLAGLIQQGII
jgi:hypothetical protein